MKKKLKRMRGGSKSKSLLTSKTSFDPLNILLVGVLIFIVYQMIQMNKSSPETIVREKIIYKTVDKEVEDDQPY